MQISTQPPDLAPPAPCALQQHPLYGQVLRDMGRDVRVVSAHEGQHHLAQAQVVRRRLGPATLNWLPRGPVWAPGLTPADRAETLRRLHTGPGLWLASADSIAESALYLQNGYRALVTPQYVAEIDLTANRDTRLAAQHGKWRNRLRHAEKSGLTVNSTRFDPARDCGLLWHEAAQRRRRGYRALPFEFILAWSARAPRAARLFTARLGAQKIAHLLVLLHAPTATYHIGWTNPQGRQVSAHNLLLWRASNWLAKKGFARLDLGTLDTEANPGLARFKIGSGADVRALGPSMLCLPRLIRPRYHAAA